MIRHLFKLVWNRRRTNGLILVELLLSFFVLCGVLTLACENLNNWLTPLGFDHENVWRMNLNIPDSGRFGEPAPDSVWETLEQLRMLLRDLDEVEAFSYLPTNVPFTRSLYASVHRFDGVNKHVLHAEVLPEAMNVLHFELQQGRWLQPGDDRLNWEPVVISRGLAEALFPGENPLGKSLLYEEESAEEVLEDDTEEEDRDRRVVGVVADYRHMGELHHGYFAEFTFPGWGPGNWAPPNYVLRMRPGVTAAFEEELVDEIHAIAPSWNVGVTPLWRHRDELIRDSLTPLMIFAIVAAFMIVMVGMGLVGVLWQSVTRRTEEIGLRRAMGATGRGVRGQILGELLALTTIAAGVGTVLFLQIPLLQIVPQVPLHVFLQALTLALLMLYSFVILCGLYPSWMATRVRPAEALQYE